MLEFDIGYVLCLGEIIDSLRDYESMPKAIRVFENDNKISDNTVNCSDELDAIRGVFQRAFSGKR